MIIGQELEMALGKPIEILGFKDGLARLCYPFTLGNIKYLNMYLSIIDQKDLMENQKDEQMLLALIGLLKDSFRVDGSELEELMTVINIDNYEELIKDIKEVSGIKDNENEVPDPNKVATDFNVAISAIDVFGSTPQCEIENMTLRQFNNEINMIQKKLNWEYKVATLSLVEKPSEYITEDEHPLHSEPKHEDGKKRVVTMKEIMSFIGEEQ